MANKTTVNFIPAGRRIKPIKLNQCKKSQPRAKFISNGSPNGFLATTEITTSICLTPKSICKNKSLPIDDYEIEINEHIVLVESEPSSVKVNSPKTELTFRQRLEERFKLKKGQQKASAPLFDLSPTHLKPTIAKKVNNKFLLHTPIVMKPAFSLDQTCINGNVQKSMKKLNCCTPKEMQSVIWPSIQRGLHVIMVGGENSGKSLSFLPLFCSFALENEQTNGPHVIILCSDLKQCENIDDFIKVMMPDSPHSVEVITHENFDVCESKILITIPKFLNLESVCLENLRHVAVEDAHVTLRSEEVGNLLKRLNDVQLNRSEGNNIQIVIASKKWSVDLSFFLRNLHVKPVVYFEDFLEAAIYCNIQFMKKNIVPDHKCFHLKDIVSSQYSTRKTVVFANEENISQISKLFTMSGIEYLAISNNLIEDEIFTTEEMWNSLQNGSYKVMLCTDDIFEKTVNILDAHWLIHYDVPTTWLPFKRRHRALAANFQPPFEHKDSDDGFVISNTSICSYLLLNEHGENQVFNEFSKNIFSNSVPHLKLN